MLGMLWMINVSPPESRWFSRCVRVLAGIFLARFSHNDTYMYLVKPVTRCISPALFARSCHHVIMSVQISV
jgi:hypothetical protein